MYVYRLHVIKFESAVFGKEIFSVKTRPRDAL